MAKFPEPPTVAVLRGITPVIHQLVRGSTVFRIFRAGGQHPGAWNALRYFGPTAARFDHHQLNTQGHPHEQKRGVMYLAGGSEAIPTCLAEVFQASRTIDTHSGAPVLCGFKLAADIKLLDLSGPFATRLGASTAIHSGPRPRAWRWAQCLYEAYPHIQGILYGSSMYANAPAIALFERAQAAIPARPVFHRQLADPALWQVIVATARKIGYGVV